jgi:hypothetical protein
MRGSGQNSYIGSKLAIGRLDDKTLHFETEYLDCALLR